MLISDLSSDVCSSDLGLATSRGTMKSLASYSMKKCSLSRMIGPLNVAPYCSVSSSVLKPRSSSIGDGSRQASEVRSQKKLPRNSLVPDLVTATTAALLIWSYSRSAERRVGQDGVST